MLLSFLTSLTVSRLLQASAGGNALGDCAAETAPLVPRRSCDVEPEGTLRRARSSQIRRAAGCSAQAAHYVTPGGGDLSSD